jgi:gas vesicle protein
MTDLAKEVEDIIKSVSEDFPDKKIFIIAFISKSCKTCKDSYEKLRKLEDKNKHIKTLIAYKENPKAHVMYKYFKVYCIPYFVSLYGDKEILSENVEDLEERIKDIQKAIKEDIEEGIERQLEFEEEEVEPEVSSEIGSEVESGEIHEEEEYPYESSEEELLEFRTEKPASRA